MDPCISVVEGLSQREKNSILAVLQRDEKLRVGQEHKITELKHEINTIRMCSVMRAGDNHGKMCLRCRSELGMIFNRGDLCPACRFKVCKQCQEVMFNGSWLCILCYKQRQLKWLSGEWAASFEQNPLRKWASGSDLKQGTLQLMPGTTEINIDDSPPRQATNNKSRKIARNGVSKHDDQKSKVEVPKEGDQVKLLELFNVLRVKKPQEEASAEMQVKHIKTRGYSDSDSDSSSNSDSEVRSSSTALSMTESEIDTHRVDSPIMEEVAQVSRLESSSQRRESSRDLDSPRRLIPHNVDKMETRSSQQVTNLESQNPAHSKHSLNSAMNQKGRSLGRAQSQGGQSKRPSLDAEAQSSMNRPGDDVSFEGSSEHSGEADSLSLHSNLNEHVRKTREILGEKHAQSQVQKVNSSIAHDHEMAARPKIRQQLVTGAEHSRKSSKQGAEANIRPSADEREMKDNEMHPYKKPVKVHVTSDSDTSSISSKSKLRASFDEDTESVGNMSVPRAGSPYSFSMESLPSSNPSPTMQRRAHHSGSLQDSSDNDSVSRGSESSSQGRHTPRKQGSEEEFVVEELSKVRFRRVANTLEKMALMTNMKKSPNRNITQDRDGVEGGGAWEHDSVAMQQGGKYLLGDSGKIIESPDITFDKLDAEGKHVKKGCVEEIHISARPEFSPEVIEKVTMQVSNQSIMSEVWNKLEGSDTNRNLLHGDSTMKTEADLSWFDDVTLNHNNVIRRQSQLKPIQRYFTSSLVESERYPSEADSIEGMIDNMAKAPLLAEPLRQELRSTLTNSESTLPDTPMSLFPEELCDRRSANYRLAYISDDNLDDDDANEVFQEEKDEILTGVLSPERKTLKAMGSLDLLLDQQGDLIGGEDEANTEIELEYQSALRYSQGENGENSSSDFEADTFSNVLELDRPLLVPKEEAEEISERHIVESKAGNMLVSQASLDILIDNQGSFIDNENKKKPKRKPLLVSKEETAEISKKHVVESKAGQQFVTQSSLDILIEKQGSFIDTEYKKKPKAKLSAQSSLDVLIEKQGKYIDFDADSAELDPDFLDSIRQEFDERIIASKAMDKKQTKDYVYLGVLHATSHNANETGQLVDNGNEGNASEVAASRKAKENEANQNLTKAMFLDARKNDSDSSDSDMLSIIEEADVEHELNDNADEVSEHITEDKCVHIPKEAVHIETLAHHENTTLNEEKSNEEPIIEKHVHVKPQTVPMLQKTIIHEEAAHFEALVHYENTTFNEEKSNVEPIVEKHVHVKPQSVPMFQKTIIHEEAANFEALAHHENTPQNVEKFTVEPILEKHVNVKPQTVPMLQKTINEAVPPPKPPRAKHNTLHDAILKLSYTEQVPITDCETKDLEIDKNKQKYKKIQEHWLAVEKQEHDDFVPDDTDTASVAHAIDETVESEQKVELETSNNQTTTHTITNWALPFTKSEANEKNAGHQGIRFQGVCHSISDNEAEVKTQRKEKRMTITSDDSCYSIEDADYVCKENVSDEEVFTNLGHLEAGQVDARVPEEEQPVDYHVHEAVEACHSIADAVPSKSKESTKDSYGVIPEETADDSKTVGPSHSPLKRLSGEKADPASYVSKGVFKTEVDLFLDESGHVSPPVVSDTEFFKVPPPPERPARRKKSSTSTSPKSTDYDSLKAFDTEELITEENPATRVESPQSVSENSSIHEDSGHGSGASQVTTPEHKRTDSSFSQSSIPSTHSTVTDDSRESIASYYSDAGDVSYSKIPVTGEILFSISYNYKTGMLEVGIKNCKDIAVVDAKRNRSDPYVKTYLLPDRTRGGKRKTKVKKSTINPQFDETLRYSISKSELENRTLWVTVWHNDRFGRNVFLGEVTINFDYYKFDDPSPRWYPLQERMDYQPAAMMVYKGDLSISLRYVTAEHSSKLSGKKEVKSGVKGQGQLEVTVKEARNLTGVKSNGFSDPFCKGYLLPERHKSSKQKTKVIRKDCNPCWNHTFIFEDVSLAELKERCLELTVWDYEKLSSNDFLGGARLNLGSGESQGHQVDWMDARGEEMSMWQAMLDRPNLWIDGVLILRANMDKRKY
ncbi:uncharacterized protein LOC127850016 isoform X2 [Dreissena polymorpha]|uniref:uncharacterized protein LOC127850016 isoform X2 n=1 Tax=Dreissena polymorpha TaxID=45954 RepID=UPI0022650235|nr:uncharacterized protein LOC127850016 isoform X2 [Dreissena polymorpha]